MGVVTIGHTFLWLPYKWTHVQLTGVIFSVTITNNMFTVVRYVMFELSLLYIKFTKAYTIVFTLR